MPRASITRLSLPTAVGLLLIACGFTRPAAAIDYPGPPPGKASANFEDGQLVLENAVIRATWRIEGPKFNGPQLVDRRSGATCGNCDSCGLWCSTQQGNSAVHTNLEARQPPTLQRLAANPEALRIADREGGWRASVVCAASDGRFPAVWSAVLRDNSNVVRWELTVQQPEQWLAATAVNMLALQPAAGAHVVGDVDGSPVVVGNLFVAAEDPQAVNRVVRSGAGQDDVFCAVPLHRPPAAQAAWRYSAVAGVAPAGQMRRAFLYYLERQRPRPYQPFLHYNSWYDIAWHDRKMDETQCLAAIDTFGRELCQQRQVKLDALVFDDGWDDNATLWRFHRGFPHGFAPLTEAARRYQTGVGAWLSPWGGYATAKDERLKYGRTQAFETNSRGFSLAGPKYYERFRDVCAEMVRRDGVNYFKYDGVGAGLSAKTGGNECGGDINALLYLCDDLRSLRPDLYLSITTGTWPSPWWLWHGDSIWRNGNDMGLHGPGPLRQQWITYRDMITYQWIVRRAPLYPLNSLMTQGVAQARFGVSAGFADDLQDLADEIRSFFASGTQLQELYLSPQRMTPAMWDLLAECARWSRSRADVLCDVHWLGGDPGQQQIYGWGAWSANKGMLALRNPSPQPGDIVLDIGAAFELPAGAATQYELHSPWKRTPSLPPRIMRAGQTQQFRLAPFEVVVFDAAALPAAQAATATAAKGAGPETPPSPLAGEGPGVRGPTTPATASAPNGAPERIARVIQPPVTPARPRVERVVLEMSLKPFFDLNPTALRVTCREAFRQWSPLVDRADAVAVMLWTADGSEILEYRGQAGDEIRWSKYIGHPNPRQVVPHDPEKKALHSGAYLYRPHPPKVTYGDLAVIVATLKEVGRSVTGKPVRVGATFDPGGEFAYSPFKYEKHNEICLAGTMGKGSFVGCYATLNADRAAYAGFPDGIPQGTPLGTFFGRQCQHFLADLGFDYIWFSNGFGFGLETWKTTGPLFDGQHFTPGGAGELRAKILDFWKLFRAECPRFPIETRGTNLATGIDLASNASPLADLYAGDFNMEPPPNSPWAALNGDFGLELAGYMSRIAELPAGKGYPFRFYVHDPWWLNSPWLDRYDRQPHDIYLPLAVGRVNAAGRVETPRSIAILTIDDSYGRMPEKCPLEIAPHILAALEHKPDRPGPLVWLYPLDEYQELVFGPQPRPAEPFFGDWFIRAAINDGLPLNTVVSSRSFLSHFTPLSPGGRGAGGEGVFSSSILVTPVPQAGSRLSQALLEHIRGGGSVLFYGPTDHADSQLLELFNLQHATPFSGELTITLADALDKLGGGAYSQQIMHRENMSAGGCGEKLLNDDDPATHVVARLSRGKGQWIAALWRKLAAPGGTIAWVRGTNSASYTGGHLLTMDNRQRWFPGDLLMRAVLPAFGYDVQMEKESPEQASPVVAIARHAGGLFFSGYMPDTTVGLRLRLPDGAPIFLDTEARLAGGQACYHFPRAWHQECRVLVRQEEGLISCVEQVSGETGVTRRFLVKGLKDATVTFLPDTGLRNQVTMQPAPQYPFIEGPFLNYRREGNPAQPRLVAEHVSGTLLISW